MEKGLLRPHKKRDEGDKSKFNVVKYADSVKSKAAKKHRNLEHENPPWHNFGIDL